MKNQLIVEPTGWYGKPLCVIGDYFIRYYKGRIIWQSLSNDRMEKSLRLPLKGWQKFLVQNRLFERILHIDVRWAVPLNKQEFLFLLKNKVYKFNLQDDQLSVDFTLKEGKPLSFLHIQECKGFKESIVIGDYSANMERKEVNIYRRDINQPNWEVAYTFPRHTIRHIHGMVQDTQRQCIYIMTGDEDSESGIWITEDDFKTVRPIVKGKQLYRCCQMLVGSGSLLYLTDAPSEDNYICKMHGEQVEQIAKIQGSVIYGIALKDVLIFSTTVEPEAYAANQIKRWLSNQHGRGIEDNYVHVCVLDADGEVEEVMTGQHDGLPLRLCQYAVANFCSDGEKAVYFSMGAVRKEDNHIFRVNLVNTKLI